MESMMLERKPAPGSPEAIALGCICPHDENQGGDGVAHMHEQQDGIHFCVARECSIHGFRT